MFSEKKSYKCPYTQYSAFVSSDFAMLTNGFFIKSTNNYEKSALQLMQNAVLAEILYPTN